jgi:copper(I)-binding protein
MTQFKDITFAAALTLGAILGFADAHAHETKAGGILIGHPWARQSPSGVDVAAGYMTITNSGTEADRLVKATATIAPTVQLHEMKMEGDVMKMAEIQGGILIPPGATVELKPKSLHVMFMELKTPVKEGDVFTGTLTFEKAGTVEVEYQVKAPHAGMN